MKLLKTIKIDLKPKNTACILLVLAPFFSLMIQSILISLKTCQTQLKVPFSPFSRFTYTISVMVFIIGLVKIYAKSNQDNYQFN